MKMPLKPPPMAELLRKQQDVSRLNAIIGNVRGRSSPGVYLHWDKLRHLAPPEGITLEEWWLTLKIQRSSTQKDLPLLDKQQQPFRFCIPDLLQEELHQIDMGAGRAIGVPDAITNPQTRDRYLIRSQIEEAITSSQLEGAVTTREVAKEMIRTGRTPRDPSEQMILNNFLTMQRIAGLKEQPLTAELLLEIHRWVTEKTLDDPTAAGRFRRPDEVRVVGDDFGQVFHEPPHAEELPARCQAMCDFANGKSPDFFIHPAIRAIILHFWLAYDHPFVDGNGRTARALFYWAMLRSGYWLIEYISISTILRKAPAQYGRSFLYTETDDNDLTYFMVAQSQVIRQAIAGLHAYIDRKAAEVRELEMQLHALHFFNHRQADLIRHALKHPLQDYTIASHGKCHNVVYQTARTDLLDLATRGVLDLKKRGKKMVFAAARDLPTRLRQMEKDASQAGLEKPEKQAGNSRKMA